MKKASLVRDTPFKEKAVCGGVNTALKSVIYHLGDLEIVTIPGELFSTFGMEIKSHLKAPVRMIWDMQTTAPAILWKRMSLEKAMKVCRHLFLKAKQSFTSAI